MTVLERERLGAYNVVGPRLPATLGDVIDACVRCAAPSRLAEPVWIEGARLLEEGVQPWSELPLWAPGEGSSGMLQISNVAAIAAGFEPRPIDATVMGVMDWLRSGDDVRGAATTLSVERERQLLEPSLRYA